ncbi:MAG: hypothetical protein KDD76_04330, partial [Rickettsiales bacterium]|nr:hypothetical protein [Rickettsiales bacterium]
MINNTILRRDRFILQMDSARPAELLKAALAGTSKLIPIAPYGHNIHVAVDGSDLKITREDEAFFAYEEVRCIVKKMHLFGKLSKKNADHILDMARRTLSSRLTLFYPNIQAPVVEVAFAYNWASFGFTADAFENIATELNERLAGIIAPTAKLFDNNTDTYS